jgi:septal ring factor EnvC (AmiA/AmiB activator)
MATVEKIRRDLEKNKEKMNELQKKQRALEAQLAEEENLEIVRMVKAVKMDNQELTAFLKAYASGLITLPEDMMAADTSALSEDMEDYGDEA